MTVQTALVPVSEVLPLRAAVLRPGLPPAGARFEDDDAPGAFHVAARDEAGAVTACGSWLPEPCPRMPSGGPAYRIRGVASDPAVRGRGHGAAVLAAGTDEAARRGAVLLWCTGRTGARGFWEHQGYEAVGEGFVIEGVGPHLLFVRALEG